MSADKRTPHTDALETLGMIHHYTEKRDAIHLGVEPVEAGEQLAVGATIGIKNGKAYQATKRNGIKPMGIVDPFLDAKVLPGQRFWLVVMPRAITSLRHVWEHPDFPADLPSEPARVLSIDSMSAEEVRTHVVLGTSFGQAYQFMIEYANSLSDDYHKFDANDLIEGGRDASNDDVNYLVGGGAMEGERPSQEFWDNLGILLSKPIHEDNRNNFFSCSC